MPIFLWTDIIIWLLVVVILVLLTKSIKRNNFKEIIMQLFASKTFVVCLLILLVYITIGLLDSIHYMPNKLNTANNMRSVLDDILLPWSNISEITFTAPFDKLSFVKDKIILADGSMLLDYPEISYYPKNLNILLVLFNISLIIFFSGLFTYGLSRYIKYLINYFELKNKLNNINIFYNNIFPRKTFYITLFSILTTIAVLLYLYKFFHILGTDKIGRDVFYLSIKSIRTGLLIGSLTSVVMLPLSLLFGTLAGYYSGKTDDIIQYVYITLGSIPGVLLIAAAILIIQAQINLHPSWFKTIEEQADLRLLALCAILGVTGWSGLCRFIRAETMKIKQLDFVTAARAMRVSDYKIITRHIIPNLMHIIILYVVLEFSGLVLAESVLSYIGIGVDPTTISWGNMINAARSELSRDPVIWWTITAAFIPMFIFVLALNLLSDKLREAVDPRTRIN